MAQKKFGSDRYLRPFPARCDAFSGSLSHSPARIIAQESRTRRASMELLLNSEGLAGNGRCRIGGLAFDTLRAHLRPSFAACGGEVLRCRKKSGPEQDTRGPCLAGTQIGHHSRPHPASTGWSARLTATAARGNSWARGYGSRCCTRPSDAIVFSGRFTPATARRIARDRLPSGRTPAGRACRVRSRLRLARAATG